MSDTAETKKDSEQSEKNKDSTSDGPPNAINVDTESESITMQYAENALTEVDNIAHLQEQDTKTGNGQISYPTAITPITLVILPGRTIL